MHGKQAEDTRNNGVGGMASNHAAAAYNQEGYPPAEDEVFVVVFRVVCEGKAAAP